MMTARISMKKHLEEYVLTKFNSKGDHVVSFPDTSDLYHVVHDLMTKRPVDCVDQGNIEINLPDRRVGKDPLYYNYISERSQRIIESKVETMFWAELHDYCDYRHHQEGDSFNDCIYMFLVKYGIKSITEDALLKNYYRWRGLVRRKRRKRGYEKQKK